MRLRSMLRDAAAAYGDAAALLAGALWRRPIWAVASSLPLLAAMGFLYQAGRGYMALSSTVASRYGADSAGELAEIVTHLRSMSRRQAIATLVSQPEHVLGACVLAQSLADSLSSVGISLIALVFPSALADGDTAALRTAGWRLVPAPPSLGRARIQLWSLTEFHAVLYLDYSSLVLRNVKNLLALPSFACAGQASGAGLDARMMLVLPDATLHAQLLAASTATEGGADPTAAELAAIAAVLGHTHLRLAPAASVSLADRASFASEAAWHNLRRAAQVLHFGAPYLPKTSAPGDAPTDEHASDRALWHRTAARLRGA